MAYTILQKTQMIHTQQTLKSWRLKALTFCNSFDLLDFSRPHLPYYDKMCFFSSYICTVKCFHTKFEKIISKLSQSHLRVGSESLQRFFKLVSELIQNYSQNNILEGKDKKSENVLLCQKRSKHIHTRFSLFS